MRLAIMLLLGTALLVGCSTERLPRPYEGYTHSSAEHGYWREMTETKARIGELHLHAGGMSVTYEPFEIYKDYWGSYSLDAQRRRISLDVDGGNQLPTFDTASGECSLSDDTLVIRGVSLDSRRPGVSVFRFSRFYPK